MRPPHLLTRGLVVRGDPCQTDDPTDSSEECQRPLPLPPPVFSPQKEFFQDDLYPDTEVWWEPVLSAAAWLGGSDGQHRKISLQPKAMTPGEKQWGPAGDAATGSEGKARVGNLRPPPQESLLVSKAALGLNPANTATP